MSELYSIRGEIAASRGLDARAAGLLTGSTLGEIEASADALAQLVGAHDERERDAAPVDLLAASRQQKAHRQRALTDALLGRQPRDEAGRFVGRGGGFDGCARGQSLRAPADPVAEHGRLAADLISQSRQARRGPADVGANF